MMKLPSSILLRLAPNPIVVKELRSRMRGSRAFLILTVYLGGLSLVVGLILLGYSLADTTYAGPALQQSIGQTIFGVVAGLELLTICFVAPALTSASISAERERQTFDLLRATPLPARALVGGKLLAALAFLGLLLLAAFPLQSLGLLFGGIAAPEVLIATLMLAATALLFCSAGLFFSSLTHRTLVATVLAYGFAILLVFGLPVLLFILIFIGERLAGSFGAVDSAVFEVVFISVGWLLVSTNPLAAAIATELILIEQQSVFAARLPLSSGSEVAVLSPWISYLVFSLLLSLILVLLSILFVDRIER